MQQTVKPEHFKTTWLKQSGNLLAADLIGTVIEAGFIANVDKFDKAFPTIAMAIKDTLKIPIYYLQRPIEASLTLTKNFEGQDYYNKRLEKSEAERVEDLAKGAYHYGMALGIGWASMWAAEHYALSKATNAPKIGAKFFMRDAAIHVGLIGLMATPMMANTTQKLKDTVKIISKGFGADEQKAEDMARISVFSFVPNYTTFAIISGMMHRDLRLQSLYKDLNSSATTALIPHH